MAAITSSEKCATPFTASPHNTAASGRFVGAGIGVPGIIDMESGMMRKSANLPGWSDYPVRDEIERRLGARVFLDNDAKMAALGENGWAPAAESTTWR